ncbi:OmpA family protein [Flavobacterium sp.]|uniref:OmpA family protein n=1 Tax=Flavobacterium sp. TaxID=239 RepID=UPI002B4ABAB9|nr:OmpA family protein [Flavobacterium sp.]HLP63560.1 OmpA family protein [Flavobacterium sp.]
MKSILRGIFLFLWIGTACSFSQNNSQLVKEITVYFESASSVISKAEAIKMEDAIQSLTDSHLYSIELTAHTDSEGSAAYNDNLSAQRAKSVADFLVNNGFFNRKISFVAQGEHQPIAENETDSGKAQNRRVTVKIQKKFDDKLSVGGFTIEEKDYTISAENPQKIEHPSGTVIEIPENAFVDKNGNPVTGDVQVSYVEYRDPVDFILGNIPMDYNQDGEKFVFNSGGMFKIKATHQGEEVFLGKDKNINLDFPLTENLPDLNFYRFDETTNQWKEEAKNINPPKNESIDLTTFFRTERIVGVGTTVDTIARDTIANRGVPFLNEADLQCYNVAHYLKMGKILSSSTDTLMEKKKWTSRKMEKVNNKKQRTLEFQISNSERIKRVHIENQKAYDVKCKVKTESDNEIRITTNTNSYPDKLNAIKWIRTSTTAVESGSLINIKREASNLYVVTISDSLGKKTTEKLKMADFTAQNEAIVNTISRQINNRQIQIKRLEDLATNQSKIIENKKRLISKLKKVKYANNDTILKSNQLVKRFWEFNNEFMTDEEKLLTEDQWVTFFDANKSLFSKRYKEIENKQVQQCLERVKELERAKKNSIAIYNAETTVRQRLSISSLGIFNCDQIQRLFEPLIVNAEYSDQENNKIIPVFIYIVDEKINGLLKYDGYMGFSPNRFAYSPKSKTTLLAFDAVGNAYIYTKEKMKQLDTNKTHHHFVLEKINTISNKDELAALLN